MKIKDITLLTADEYEKYKLLIPDINTRWWLLPQTQNTICYVDENGAISNNGYANSNICYVRPVLKIADHNMRQGTLITVFDLLWIVLDENLAICSKAIGKENFNTSSNSSWEASSLKKMLDEWFANQCKKETFYVAIKNKVEYSLVQSLCKKFDIDFVATDFNNLIRYYDSIFFAYTPCKKRLIHNNIYDTTRIISFEEYCDYIAEKY